MNKTSLTRLKTLTVISLALNSILLIAIVLISSTLLLSRFHSKPKPLPIVHTTTLELIADNTNTIKPETPTAIEPEKVIAIEPEKVLTVNFQKQVSRGVVLNDRQKINGYVQTISSRYNIDPKLIESIIQQESEYLPRATNGECLGLMQISHQWHSKRAADLGITDFYDPYSNVLLGVDYLAELFDSYKDPSLVLMLYSMDHKTAFKMYTEGKISGYAKTVLARAEVYRKGG